MPPPTVRAASDRTDELLTDRVSDAPVGTRSPTRARRTCRTTGPPPTCTPSPADGYPPRVPRPWAGWHPSITPPRGDSYGPWARPAHGGPLPLALVPPARRLGGYAHRGRGARSAGPG